MIQPRFCFTSEGYREQARNLEDGDLYDCITSYRDNLGLIGNFLAMYGIPPRWVDEFSDELLEREIAKDRIIITKSLEQVSTPLP